MDDPQQPNPPTPHTHTLAPLRVVITYTIMAVLAVGGSLFFADRLPIRHPDFNDTLNHPLNFALGLGVGVAVVILDRICEKLIPAFRRMAEEFRLLIGPMTHSRAILYALASSIGEELLFRGALQPWAGLTISSILFGAMHIPPNRRLLPWPFIAIAMGFAFGALFQYTGDLLAPILAHFTINYFGFVHLSKEGNP